jgi:hypothetical protein
LPEATRRALRDVVGRCLYGVDVNAMAVELCKVALWMEAVAPADRSASSLPTSSAATACSEGTLRDGSDGTRTRDLRRDRPVLALAGSAGIGGDSVQQQGF